MPNDGGLTDREAAIDAIIRFVCALDEGDPELSASSLTEDATMDLSPFQKAGLNYEPVHGRANIVDRLMKAVGKPLDTTHSATNIRCTVEKDTAKLTCCVLAQHFRGGQGPSPEFQDYYLFGNQYKATLVRSGELWRVNMLTIAPAWTQGNPDVMKV
ncbi:Fc.00g093320.m01.CDS01 [Cosmosporella sp. VM-42]